MLSPEMRAAVTTPYCTLASMSEGIAVSMRTGSRRPRAASVNPLSAAACSVFVRRGGPGEHMCLWTMFIMLHVWQHVLALDGYVWSVSTLDVSL